MAATFSDRCDNPILSHTQSADLNLPLSHSPAKLTAMPDSPSITNEILSAVDSVLADRSRPIPLHVPTFAGNEWQYVKDCIDTGWVSSVGAYVSRFEEDMARYTGAKHAVAVGTGTAALHIALLMAGVKPGDEVLCPSLTFVATANAVSYCQAVPHFVDVEARTLGIDPAAIRAYAEQHMERRDDGYSYNKQTGRRIGALVGMHAFGHPFDLDGVVALCEDLGCPLVEDAAESLGSFYKGKHTGTFGRLGTISFNGNKIITTGGGGMILTDDAELAAKAKHLTTTGKAPHPYEYVHDVVAYNYRMPSLNAALGCGQLEAIQTLLKLKRALAQRYIDAFDSVEHASIMPEPEGCSSNHWLNTLVLSPEAADATVPTIEALIGAGVLVRPVWKPMHELVMYKDCPRMELAVTEDLATRVINLPSTADL